MPSLNRYPLLMRLEHLVRQAQSITFIVPDDTGFFSIEDDLVHRVRRLVEKTLELLRDIMAYYEEVQAPIVPFESSEEDAFLREIGAAISSELAAREISDMAFVSRTQLLEGYEGLMSALENDFVWVVASHADTSLRRVGKSLISIESAVRDFEGLPPVERRWSDLADSLEIRRLYGQFRRSILRGEETLDGESLQRRLRAASNRIAILRDLKIYPFLRIYDRVPIRRLQKRILAWLERSPADPETESEGRRLWSDLRSFAELLRQINNREELREHDRRTVNRIYRLLFEPASPPERPLPAHVEDLEKLLGRDDELDLLVLDAARQSSTAFQAPLERLRRHLDQTPLTNDDTLGVAGARLAE
ncbi:MAG: hypothetical protein AAGN46_04750 [Acidobacteriota bacterium]